MNASSSSTPPLHAEVRDKVETLIAKLEETSVGFYGYQEGYLAKEPEPYDVQECADEVLQAVADALLAAVQKERRSKPDGDCSNWAEGVYQGHNEALDAVTRVIGELRGDSE